MQDARRSCIRLHFILPNLCYSMETGKNDICIFLKDGTTVLLRARAPRRLRVRDLGAVHFPH